jgi:hypothetical protein
MTNLNNETIIKWLHYYNWFIISFFIINYFLLSIQVEIVFFYIEETIILSVIIGVFLLLFAFGFKLKDFINQKVFYKFLISSIISILTPLFFLFIIFSQLK